jgi:hypothetical protein
MIKKGGAAMEVKNQSNPELTRLIAERDQFLKEHPELEPLQKEIDHLLGTSLDPHERQEIFLILMAEKLNELRGVMIELSNAAIESIRERMGN